MILKFLIQITIFVNLTNTYAQEKEVPFIAPPKTHEFLKKKLYLINTPPIVKKFIKPIARTQLNYDNFTEDYTRLKTAHELLAIRAKKKPTDQSKLKLMKEILACYELYNKSNDINKNTLPCCTAIVSINTTIKNLIRNYDSSNNKNQIEWGTINEDLRFMVPKINELNCKGNIPTDLYISTQDALFGESETTKRPYSIQDESCTQSLSDRTEAKSELINWHFENNEPNTILFNNYEDSLRAIKSECRVKFNVRKSPQTTLGNDEE